MTTVTAVRTNDWKKDDGTVTKVTNVTLDDGREVPGYDLPSEPEIGKPLPDGWEVATSAKGKPYIKVPKPGRGGGGFGGGAAAFRNTKEGQAAEQRSIHASVALGHAITLRPNGTTADILKVADELVAWLTKASGTASSPSQGFGAGGSGASPPSHPSPASPDPTFPADEGRGMSQNRTHPKGRGASPATPQEDNLGKVLPAESGVCDHENVSLSKPDGSPLPSGFYRCGDCGYVGRVK